MDNQSARSSEQSGAPSKIDDNRSWMYKERKVKFVTQAWQDGLDALVVEGVSVGDEPTEIDPEEMRELEKEIPVLLCKLEKMFPPGFFNVMQHLIVHLPYEARLGIADEAFTKIEKSNFKSRRVMASQLVRSAREDHLEKENIILQRQNKHYRGIELVVRSLAEKGGLDFDALMQSVAPDMATSDSEVGVERARHVGLGSKTAENHSPGKDDEYDNMYGDEGDYGYGNGGDDGYGDDGYGDQPDDYDNDQRDDYDNKGDDYYDDDDF